MASSIAFSAAPLGQGAGGDWERWLRDLEEGTGIAEEERKKADSPRRPIGRGRAGMEGNERAGKETNGNERK